MEWFPGVKTVVNWARPFWKPPVMSTVARVVVPSRNLTLSPLKVLGERSPPVTVAVKVIGWPALAGLTDAVSVVVVGDKTVRSSRTSRPGRHARFGRRPGPAPGRPGRGDFPAPVSQEWIEENHMAAFPFPKRSAVEWRQLVPARRPDAGAASGRRDRTSQAAIGSESALLLAQTGVPDPHCSVDTAADEALAVGAEDHGIHQVHVPLEGQGFVARGRIPDLHCLVVTGADDALAVGAIGHAVDRAAMPPQGQELLAGGRVPDLHRVVC